MEKTITYSRRFTMVFISHATRGIFFLYLCLLCTYARLLYCMLSIFTFTSETKVVKSKNNFPYRYFLINTSQDIIYSISQHTLHHHIPLTVIDDGKMEGVTLAK